MPTARTTRRAREEDGQRKGDRREQAILSAAEALLETTSYDRLTVEALAREAGISRASLYFYFGSKDDVLVALAARSMAVLVDDARGAVEETELDPLATIERSIRRVARLWVEHGPVLRLMRDHAAVVPELGAFWDSTIGLQVDLTETLLRRTGVPAGGPGSARRLAEVLCHMTAGAFYRVPPGPGYEREVLEAAKTVTFVWRRTIEQP